MCKLVRESIYQTHEIDLCSLILRVQVTDIYLVFDKGERRGTKKRSNPWFAYPLIFKNYLNIPKITVTIQPSSIKIKNFLHKPPTTPVKKYTYDIIIKQRVTKNPDFMETGVSGREGGDAVSYWGGAKEQRTGFKAAPLPECRFIGNCISPFSQPLAKNPLSSY